MYDKATGMIKSMDELEKLYGKLDKNKRIIPHCQTGTRSTLTYLAFRLMGFKNPANYDDSWIIWGNREDAPIEK
jgi:thiosulfate/3-mercaptopyruvate sulfurtransferase